MTASNSSSAMITDTSSDQLAVQQREALADLIRLSQDCESRDQDITQFVMRKKDRADRLKERAQSRIKRYFTQLIKSDEEALRNLNANLEDNKEERKKEFRHEISRERGDVLNKIDRQRQKVKSKADEEIWLIESHAEDLYKNITKENRKNSKELKQLELRLQDTRNDAQDLLTKFKSNIELADLSHEPNFDDLANPSKGDASKSGASRSGGMGSSASRASISDSKIGSMDDELHPVDEPETSIKVEDYALVIEKLTETLKAVHELKIPSLIFSWKPYAVIVFAIFASALLGAAPGLVLAWPPLMMIGTLAGAVVMTIIISAVVIAVLKKKGRQQFTEAMEEFADQLIQAKTQYPLAVQTEDHRAYLAKKKHLKKRAYEIKKIKDKYQPQLAELTKKRRNKEEELHSKAQNSADSLKLELQMESDHSTAYLRHNIQTNKDNLKRLIDQSDQRYTDRMTELSHIEKVDRDTLAQQWESGKQRITSLIAHTQQLSESLPKTWDDERLKDFSPPRKFTSFVRFGELSLDHRQKSANAKYEIELPDNFYPPAFIEFLQRASVMIETPPQGRDAAVNLVSMLMLRLLVTLPPGKLRFTLIDPVGLGENFAGFMHLSDFDENLVGRKIWTEPRAIAQRLNDLTEHMENVIQKYLRNDFQNIDQYNQQAGELAEPYHYLVIADFPNAFDEQGYKKLSSIANAGARCGVQLIILRDTRSEVGRKNTLHDLHNHCITLRYKDGGFEWVDDIYRHFKFRPDPTADEDTLTRLLSVVGEHASSAGRVEVDFNGIAPNDDELWSRSSAETFMLPIGKSGATRIQQMGLGKGVAQHVLIAGKTGSGKSTLLNIMITNTALWYSPDEVRFYLIDFKKGVEFKSYATQNLPHAEAIAIESDREFGLSVLEKLDQEMTERGDLYRASEVQNLPAYREAHPETPMPRIVLIIDEFQEFFTEDDRIAQNAALMLDRLVRQGRAFGMHVILGSQSLSGVSGLGRGTLGQMAVRVALQCAESDSQLILSDSNTAARLLNRPGEAIYNDSNGLVEANSPFQVAWLSDQQRDDNLKRVTDYAEKLNLPVSHPVVFEGNAQADISVNPLLIEALNTDGDNILAAKAWLGEPVAIKEATSITFHRQSGNNVLLIGQQEENAMDVMMAMMLSLSANNTERGGRFRVLDGSPADSTLHGRLKDMSSLIPQKTENLSPRQLEEQMQSLAEEIDMRLEADRTDAPAIYVMVYGLQRYRDLRPSDDSFSSFSFDEEKDKKATIDQNFQKLIKEGPAVGVHLITWVDTYTNLERTVPRNLLREFDQRVLFQMSANDSSALIDNTKANLLGFYKALLYSEENGMTETFRPYGAPPRSWVKNILAK